MCTARHCFTHNAFIRSRAGQYQKIDDGMVLNLNIAVLLNITILPFQ